MSVIDTFAAKVNPGDVGIPTVGADSVLTGVLNIVYFVAGMTTLFCGFYRGESLTFYLLGGTIHRKCGNHS